MSNFSDISLSMIKLADAGTNAFAALCSFEKVWIMTPEYLLMEHFYNEFGEYPSWSAPTKYCECCDQEIE